MTDSSVPLAEAGGRLLIDLQAISDNYAQLAARVAPAACAAVLKGDAYGTGLEPAATALWNAGARSFFVALLAEAKRLRDLLPQAEVFVLNGLFAGTEQVYDQYDLRPVLCSQDDVARWQDYCAGIGRPLPAALHVDTGMNRLGLSATEAIHLAEGRDEFRFPLALVMSHLACADEPDHPLTARQLEDFRAVAALFPGVRASLANSAGALGDKSLHFDMVRPGIALYGGRSRRDTPPLRPVVRLELRIVQVREVHEGETIGYGAAQTARRPSRIAVLAAGYADGIFRLAGASDGQPGAEVVIAGRRCPLAGRVSMDLMTVDVTDLPEEAVRPGDFATLIGEGIGVDELAGHARTIGYEVLTALGRRFHRRWV
ncbi:alanine racemase [Ancylobacter oerskovii]|uniref:Alanine racemase n=1 Tax=Ancylobacter oerskovii TaxID=459519 RepID=A0ABW4Z3T5_9HYPH|nr:alanine racemase [Ancylobacter oerskovii]MBS7545914.1 alanine racemase [Ancylobacter oerskovii]